MADSRTPINIEETSHFDDSTDFESETRTRCCWCRRFVALLPKQKHCKECDAKAFRLCARCKYPYPDAKYFKLNANRCDSCQRKYLKEKQRREAKQKERDAVKSDDEDEKGEGQEKKLKRKTPLANQAPVAGKKVPKQKTISECANVTTDARASTSADKAKEERRMEDEILIWPRLKFDGNLKTPHPRWVMLPLFVLTDKKEEHDEEPQHQE